ncbi:MFS transporter [Candidatus Dependentiae bacterium]|nr:MFS transporter [Candidatus Dependentiae bacterium]
MPVFILILTDSKILVGVAAAIIASGWFLPQVFFTRWASSHQYKMPLYKLAAFIRIGAWVSITITVCFIGKGPGILVSSVFFLFLFIAYGTGGLGGIPFMDIVAKSITYEKRSVFFAMRFILGGAVAFIAGFLVKFILSTNSSIKFPNNFCILFFISAIFTTLALIAFFFVKEPPSELNHNHETSRDFFLHSIKRLSKDNNFIRFYIYRICTGFGLMSIPFIIPFGIEKLQIEKSDTGIYLAIASVLGILSNFIWQKVSKKFGNKTVLLNTALLCTLIFGILILIFFSPNLTIGNLWGLNISQVLFSLSAVLIIVTLFSDRMGYFNYLLDLAPDDSRPIYLGFMNSLVTPIMLLPLLGGFISGFSFKLLFMLSFLFSIAAFFIGRTLTNYKEVK